MTDDAQREAFEAWAATKGYDEAGMKRKGETYRYNVPQTWWEAWLASAARFDAVVGAARAVLSIAERSLVEAVPVPRVEIAALSDALRALAPKTNQQGAP